MNCFMERTIRGMLSFSALWLEQHLFGDNQWKSYRARRRTRNGSSRILNKLTSDSSLDEVVDGEMRWFWSRVAPSFILLPMDGDWFGSAAPPSGLRTLYGPTLGDIAGARCLPLAT